MFDYDNIDGPDLETVGSVAADMANAGKPPPMSDTEREEWQAWREQQEWLAEHQRRESERVQAEKAEAERIESGRRAQNERAERTRALQEQLRQQSDQRLRDAKLDSLHRANIRNEQFRQGMMRSAAYATSRQELDSLLTNYMELKYPKPAAEPPVVIVEQQDDDTFCGVKIPRWR